MSITNAGTAKDTLKVYQVKKSIFTAASPELQMYSMPLEVNGSTKKHGPSTRSKNILRKEKKNSLTHS